MQAVRQIVAALNKLVRPPPAGGWGRGGARAGPLAAAEWRGPLAARRLRAPCPAEDSAYARAGTEPCLDEMLRDPIVQLVIRADRLEPAEVRGVLDAARRSAASGGPRRPPPTAA